jgi:hypothetical protein
MQARLACPTVRRAFIGRSNLCEAGRAKQHKRQISRRNLRMHPCAKLTSLSIADQPAYGVALQSNKVYPPRLSPLYTTGIAARRINAVRWASPTASFAVLSYVGIRTSTLDSVS